MSLAPKQSRFVDEYLIDLNGAQAAIRAGYSPGAARVQASRLLTKANIRALIEQRQAETALRLQIRREDVVLGLLEAVEIAREQGDARAMVMAAAELNKMLGLYPSEKGSKGPKGGRRRLETLSDTALLRALGEE